jgi:acyl dehydratase
MATKYFEDYEIGSVETVGDYLVEENEIIEFARRWDPQPYHIDADAAKASIFGGLTASACHTFAICTRIFHDEAGDVAMVASLGHEEVRLPSPVRPGDRLAMTSEVLERRKSRGHPGVGIVTTRASMRNQRDEIVYTMKTSFMVQMRTEP